MNARVNITSPVGRLLMGSLYDPRATDAEGKPLVVKAGTNAGQPRVDFFFVIGIPKNPGETHWAQTPWGAEIWKVGHTAFPAAAQAEDFSWKIVDGDSTKPGKLFKGKPGKPPCENEGWKGHWILKFSGGFAPKIYQAEGTNFVQVLQKDFVKAGYFVEVAFSVEGNKSQTSPGVYLNHSMVCFRAYGQEITFGPDVSSAGFGGGALPMGATMTPPASAVPLPQLPNAAAAPVPVPVPGYAPAVGAMPATPPAYAAPVPMPMPSAPAVGAIPSPLAPAGFVPTPAAPAPIAPAQIPVMPNPAFVQVPPPAMPAAPAAPVKQMTAAANGIPYDAYIAQGWTDALLIQNGMMLA